MGKRFVDDIFERPGVEGDLAHFSDDSNASDLDISSSDEDAVKQPPLGRGDNKSEVSHQKKKFNSKFSMNSALKLHQKLFLKLKEQKKKFPSSIERLLTPFSSDLLQNDKKDQKDDDDENGEDKSDEDDRDSSEDAKERQERENRKNFAAAE